MRKLLVILLTVIFWVPMKGVDHQHLKDSLNRELARVHTPVDSLHIYYDMFDLSKNRERMPLMRKILELARRSHNINAQYDMLMQMANVAEMENSDSVILECEAMVKQLPDIDLKKPSLVFITMKRISQQARMMTDSARTNFFREEMNKYPGDEQATLTEQLLHHFTVMMFMGGNKRGSLFSSNIRHLGELVEKLPVNAESLRNNYYTQAARMYTMIGDYNSAVSTDRDMLRGIGEMEKRYYKQGRKYRNFETYYYIYRRMLVNYRGLRPEEVDSIYSKIEELAKVNSDVATDLSNTGRPTIFYLLAKGRNKEALELLKEKINLKSNSGYRTMMLKEAVAAAQAEGDKEAMLLFMPEYIKDMEELTKFENMAETMNKEVDYRINEYKRNKDRLDAEIAERNDSMHKLTVYTAVIATIVLLAFIAILFRLYKRSIRLANDLSRRNQELKSERDKLRRSEADLRVASERANKASTLKEDFINNISREIKVPLDSIVEYSQFIVDNMDVDRKKYLQSFADVITLSAELITTLISDLLNASSMEKGVVEVNKRPVDVRSICNMALGNIQSEVAPGVEVELVEPENVGSTIITTDPQRVDQVLLHLLTNAAKFTEEGSIKLSYEFSTDRKTIKFAVTDTGIGIPAGKEEAVFQRFEKLDNHAKGLGLGLYISSMVTRLLKGELKVDTDYKDGARFVFEIPTN